MPTSKVTKAVLAMNAATVIRAFRYGPREAVRRAIESFDKLDPFGGPVEASPEVLEYVRTIPFVDVDDLKIKSPVIRLDSRQRYINGALPNSDLMALLTMLVDWNPNIVVEIGTFNGSTTAAIALNAPGAIVHTVDLPLDYDASQESPDAIPKDDFHLIAGRRVGSAYTSIPEIKNIVQHLVDSAKWDFAPVKGASFFFIDGAHTYEYVKNDTEKCLAVAAPKSRFLLHDCDETHADILRYACELIQQGRRVARIRNTALAYFDTE